MRQNFYVFSLYHNPDLEDWIFNCVLASVVAVQAEDVHATGLFVDDLNAIIRSGYVLRPRIVMVLHPMTSQLSGCDQLLVGPNHAHGGTLVRNPCS